jgi:cytosine/adenosine deaminase-related metal-dependent hydrolase
MADACVVLSGDRIVSVGAAPPLVEIIDLGQAAVVPGLVNAHTHLEFSDLAAPLGTPGMPLPDWIEQVVAHRRAQAHTPQDSIARGLAECLAAGTTTVGEIATHDWRPLVDAAAARPDVVMFYESIGPNRERVEAAITASKAFVEARSTLSAVRPGLSPHAPYTVHHELLCGLVDLSRQAGLPVAMHLAESREELELLATGGGAFRTLLQRLDSWQEHPTARLNSVMAYLEALAPAPRALVIHGNYLGDAEIEFLGDYAERMSVVYCPRTHDFFRHDEYPLARMLSRGVSVALGTDSRASNPDLSLWEEMRFVTQRHPQLSLAQVLELGTRGGARSLGLAATLGTLEAGKLANLAVIELSTPADDPHVALFAPGSSVRETWLRGQRVFDRPG